jgi:5-methyltetrahydrofolate corrinoid/iron sulfur protein methyltransferase
VQIAHDEQPELEELVGRIMDGEEVDISGLSKQEVDYVKTAKTLLGHSLYSHSWLEL